MQEAAISLADRLRKPGGSRAIRKQGRALLKEAFTFEEKLSGAKKATQKASREAQRLTSGIDRIFRDMNREDEEKFLDDLNARYAGPVFNVGQRIRAERVALVALQADYLCAAFNARANWFWERSERARNGVTSLGKPQDTTENPDPPKRESFELIWRRRKK